MSTDVEQYVLAADRDNTVRSYATAIRHFEQEWKGLLPATVDTVVRYLVEHATLYKISTLRLHLAALARWHADHGFADPTRATLVHKVLRGIRAKHATPQRRGGSAGIRVKILHKPARSKNLHKPLRVGIKQRTCPPSLGPHRGAPLSSAEGSRATLHATSSACTAHGERRTARNRFKAKPFG